MSIATMQKSYTTPTASQDLKVTDCIAEDLKPLAYFVNRATYKINQNLQEQGIKPKRINPVVMVKCP